MQIWRRRKPDRRRREFVRTTEIALGEAREAAYWLRIRAALELGSGDVLKELSGEGDQISRILASIVIKTKSRLRFGYAVAAFCILNFALLT